MGDLIQIQPDRVRPAIICGHCKQQIEIDISQFVNDVSKIYKDNCYKCGGEIFVSVLIMGNTQLNPLLQQIQTVIDALSKGNVLTQ
jgi:hypothetical protein